MSHGGHRRPQNIGEVIFNAISTGAGSLPGLIQQDVQNKRQAEEDTLKNILTNLRIEIAQKDNREAALGLEDALEEKNKTFDDRKRDALERGQIEALERLGELSGLSQGLQPSPIDIPPEGEIRRTDPPVSTNADIERLKSFGLDFDIGGLSFDAPKFSADKVLFDELGQEAFTDFKTGKGDFFEAPKQTTEEFKVQQFITNAVNQGKTEEDGLNEYVQSLTKSSSLGGVHRWILDNLGKDDLVEYITRGATTNEDRFYSLYNSALRNPRTASGVGIKKDVLEKIVELTGFNPFNETITDTIDAPQ